MLCLMIKDKPIEFIIDPISKKKEKDIKKEIWNILNCCNEYLIKLIKRIL